ncbi:MAG: aminotransferase [Rhodospirillales bacterium]|nr:aminotransferase [Rhodospirillales bacterium]MDH3914208.1 aminotransferase [Rhodospirillales bacterium]MDH3920910.1 aminotransferase [Rhodospirillales bacterium]
MKLNTEDARARDRHWVHPWDSFGAEAQGERTVIARSEGIYVYDTDGNKLIDGPAGMWCVNIGHGNAEIAEAVAEQIKSLTYYSPWSLSNVPGARLAQKLADLAPGDLNQVFFTTCGSTAVDSALRFVTFFNNYLGRPEKKHVISRHDAYHGSTYLSASCSGKTRDKNYLDFETGLIHHLPSPNPYRRPKGMSVEAFCDAKVADLETKILELGPDKVAAFIAEPILASGGVIVPPPGYHRGCLEVCRRHDVIYISDEVVTAFGRLGHFFASEEVFGIVPDIITTAKGLTSGYVPMGAAILSDRLIGQLDGVDPKGAIFSNGFTYSGHPVAAAAALKNIEIMERDGVLENARDIGPYFQERLRELREIPIVGDVRGMGLMACVECVISRESQDPLILDYEIGSRIDAHCQALGLLARPLINMCVLSPPLIITKAQVDDLVGLLRAGIERAMADVRREGLWEG